MLVLARPEHKEHIIRLATDFFNASPYAPLGCDRTRVEELVDAFLQSRPADRVTILWVEDGEPRGVLAAIAERNLFNESRLAAEVIWWIDPAYRKRDAADNMRKAYEYWAAKKAKCQICTLIDLMGNLDKFYKRKGYERRETTYMKVT